MRILLFTAIIMLLFSCNNDLSTIGQELMDNGDFVDMKEYDIRDISTVKLDSFLTSSGYASSSDLVLNELLMGKYQDDYSGTTVAIPCFQIVPYSRPVISENFTLDSVTFNFKYKGAIWGDTIRPTLQKFYLYRLDELPVLNEKENYLLYNNYPLPSYTEMLSELKIIPLQENIRKSYFKLETEAGRAWSAKLFEAMVYHGTIFNDLPWSFIDEFKGLAIIPDAQNNCIMNISAIADSLYLRFHFHKTNDESYYDIPFGQREYMYNSIKTDNSAKFQGLTNQQANVPFTSAGISLVQGVAGYMTKMTLPRLPIPQQYSTIIKAQLEIEPEIFANPYIAMPSSISVYSSNEQNDVRNPLYNNATSGTRVFGTYVQDPINKANSKYIFDLTDYYQRILAGSQDNITEREILLRIPNWTTSFNRAVITEIPKLRVYYAHYNNN